MRTNYALGFLFVAAAAFYGTLAAWAVCALAKAVLAVVT